MTLQERVTTRPGESSAAACRRLGWGPGTRLVGDEGYGPTVILLTAVGEQSVLARAESSNGKPVSRIESMWTLSRRDWQVVAEGPGEGHQPQPNA